MHEVQPGPLGPPKAWSPHPVTFLRDRARGRADGGKEATMAIDVYERLAQHLDNLPGGYPRTESGVELRILRRLFTPEEADLALHLTLIPEEPRVVALRARMPVEEAARRLEDMAQKGLII